MKLKLLSSSIALLLVSSCSHQLDHRYYRQTHSPAYHVSLKNERYIKQQLWAQFHEWKGTPYRYGGTSRNGIDCSAFVQKTFREKLGINLPRTTWTQVKKGHYVPKYKLRPGDIVFFKTGRHSRHDGIYLGHYKFMHASSSRGVAISDLRRKYWIRHYWTSRRII